MFETTQNEIAAKIAKLIFPKLDKYELILIIVFLICLILKTSFKVPTDVIITMVFVTLAVLYFFVGFVDIQDEGIKGFDKFMLKIVSWSCTISIIGILFGIMSWPGGELIILYGLVTSLGSLIILFLIRLKNPNHILFTNRWFVRLLIFSAILISLKLLPKEKLIDLGVINAIEYSENE